MIWIIAGSLVGLIVVGFVVREIVGRRRMVRTIDRFLTISHDLVKEIIEQSEGMEEYEQEIIDDQRS